MNKEYLEAFKIVYNNFDYLISDACIENDDVNICLKTIKEQLPTIKRALQRLESIDNAEPSEALEYLEYMGKTFYVEIADAEGECTVYAKNFNGYDTIKQALLKAQEPKHYLKWEDLEKFKDKDSVKVKMNDTELSLIIQIDCLNDIYVQLYKEKRRW